MPAQPAPTWTLVDVFAGLGVTLLLSTLLTTLVGFTGFDGGPALILIAVAPVWIALAGTTVWACRRHGTGNLVADLGLRIRWSDLLIGLGVALALRRGPGALGDPGGRRHPRRARRRHEPARPRAGPPLGAGGWVVVNVIAVTLISPFVEELFFRGLALRSALTSLWRRTGRKHVGNPSRQPDQAAWISGLLFGLLHVGEVSTPTDAAILVPGLIVAGWAMARLTLWRQRLGPAVVTHVVFNSTAVIALLAIG